MVDGFHDYLAESLQQHDGRSIELPSSSILDCHARAKVRACGEAHDRMEVEVSDIYKFEIDGNS